MTKWSLILLTNCCTYACHTIAIYLFSTHKDGKLTSVFRMLLFYVSMLALCLAATVKQQTILYYPIALVDIALMLAIIIWDSGDHLAKKVFLMLTYGVFFYFTTFACELCLYLIPLPYGYIPYIPVRLGIYTALFILWKKKGQRFFDEATRNITSGWWLLCAFSAIAYVGVSLIFLRLLMLTHTETAWDFYVCGIVLVLTTSAYVLVVRLLAFMNTESDQRQMYAREQLLQSELEAEEQFVEQARQNRHDLHHHIQVMFDYLAKNDAAGISEYLRQYEQSIETQSFPKYCKNVVANALIRRTAFRCQENGIAFTCAAEISETLPLSDTDTCILFGNLFENAYESCRRCANATLDILATVKNNKLCIQTRNSVAGTVAFADGIPVTTKKTGGIGVRSMQSVLETYGGMMRFLQEKNEFIVQIILPL